MRDRMTAKRYNTYCDQNENRTVIDDDLNNTHIFIAYCGDLEDSIRLKIALNSVTDELNHLHEENKALRKQLQTEHQMLDNAILLERTRMGQNALKQYKEAIQ